MLRIRDFDYHLPEDRIAQAPSAEREDARLYRLPLDGGAATHHRVADLVDLVPPSALLVVNDTRVIPARLRGRKPSGGEVELLLLARVESQDPSDTGRGWREVWTCLGGASKPLRPGHRIRLTGEHAPAAEIVSVEGRACTVAFEGDRASDPGGLLDAAARVGQAPLPPYIRRPDGPTVADAARYQTLYAREPGSAAAPTAGLHLGHDLLARLAARGIERVAVTLHVGLGTFAPIDLPDDAPVARIVALHPERYAIPVETAAAYARARAAGRPVIAVGTTTVRALESAALVPGESTDGAAGPERDACAHALRPGPGVTRLFICAGRPGPHHRLRAVDGMFTNFHLPRSTLLMLVAALAGRERLLAAYEDAVARGYRFYSFGDAMLLV